MKKVLFATSILFSGVLFTSVYANTVECEKTIDGVCACEREHVLNKNGDILYSFYDRSNECVIPFAWSSTSDMKVDEGTDDEGTDDEGTDDEGTGNPGNDKGVGGAGETPGPGDWGTGDLGKSQ